MNISNMKIGARLGIGFALMNLLLLGTAIIGVTRMIHVGDTTDNLVKNRFPKVVESMVIDQAISDVGKSAYGLLLAPDAAFAEKQKAEIAESRKVIRDAVEILGNTVTSPKGKEIVKSMTAAETAFFGAIDEALKLQAEGKKQEAFTYMLTKMRDARYGLKGQAQALIKFQRDAVDASTKEAAEAVSHGQLYIVSFMLTGLLIGVLVAFFISRSITRPLTQAVGVADAIALGDLDKRIEVTSADETGQLLTSMQKMVETLKGFYAAQSEMKQQHDAGTISYRIPAEQFAGSYREMAAMTNELVGAHIAVKMKIVEVVSRYAQGDLSQDMDRLPGEKAKITVAVDGVKSSLQSINGEIAKLVEAALKGDFTVRGNADKYQHDFRKMVDGLNRLMQVSDTGLNEVVRVLGALARGDLTEKITNEYQGTFGRLKDDSNMTVEKLTEIVTQIKESTESINTAAKEIASGNTDLSSRTEEQASSLEETASSMEELTSTVKQNAENAKQANQLAAGASEVAVKGGDVVGQVVTTMSSINESSKKIVDIISVIDGIAFQTNILALNAAVEAARAGEQGRGFAVVATEVRTLAQRSAAAAKEIKELIGDSVEKVGAGTKLVDEAGATMQEIVSSVKRVTDIMAEITAASQEQSAGIEQVNTAITQMDEVTQQNAALVEQAAAAAESMEEQAGNLAGAVAIFKLAGQTGRASVVARPAMKPAGLPAPRKPATVTAHASAKGNGQHSPARPKAANAAGGDEWTEF